MIETFGKHVIPEFDKDPVHLTDKFRRERQTEIPDVGHRAAAAHDDQVGLTAVTRSCAGSRRRRGS